MLTLRIAALSTLLLSSPSLAQRGAPSPEQVAEVVRALNGHPKRPVLVATGGIDDRNIADYARAGVDVIVTSAPYTAPPLDVRVSIERNGR